MRVIAIQEDNKPAEDQGFGALETAKGALPLIGLSVDTQITGPLYNTEVKQTFKNTFDEYLEATYIFPLPVNAAVSSFTMKAGERTVVGELKERAEARQAYEAAIEEGHRAALAEQERPNIFTMQVGNICPGEEIEILLSLSGCMTFFEGEYSYRFPLVVAQRYIPGKPLYGQSVGMGTSVDTDAVPDASRISPPVLLPGFPNPVDLDVKVTVDGLSVKVDEIACSLPADIEPAKDENGFTLIVKPGERLNKDFILRYQAVDKKIKASLTVAKDDRGETFMLSILPDIASAERKYNNDIVIVLDRSGSMQGWRMVAARRAACSMLDELDPGDRFAVIYFDDSMDLLFDGKLVEATERNIEDAQRELRKIQARGGTELGPALVKAAKLLRNKERDKSRKANIVLLSDGMVGNESQIYSALSNDLPHIRTFTLGIDQAANENLLQKVASKSGGAYEQVESEEQVDKIMTFFGTCMFDWVSRIDKVQCFGKDKKELLLSIANSSLVLFPGKEITVFGRLEGVDSIAELTIESTVGKKFKAKLRPEYLDNDAIHRIMARKMIQALEDKIEAGTGDVHSLREKIKEFSLRFNVLSRYTAFVAVDSAEVVNKDGTMHQMIQPVEPVEQWDSGVAYRAKLTPSSVLMRAELFKSSPASFVASGRARLSEASSSDGENYEITEFYASRSLSSKDSNNTAKMLATDSPWKKTLLDKIEVIFLGLFSLIGASASGLHYLLRIHKSFWKRCKNLWKRQRRGRRSESVPPLFKSADIEVQEVVKKLEADNYSEEEWRKSLLELLEAFMLLLEATGEPGKATITERSLMGLYQELTELSIMPSSRKEDVLFLLEETRQGLVALVQGIQSWEFHVDADCEDDSEKG